MRWIQLTSALALSFFLAACGDNPADCQNGAVEDGEECDDGNDNNGDGCDKNCTITACGNGIEASTPDQPEEECDLGADNSDTGACTTDCQDAACGDGFVLSGVEECDDGDKSNNNACTISCSLATCGDGFIHAGVETCDDGDSDDTDSCPSSCVSATCGDGFLQSGVEVCDDNNAVSGDGCSGDCSKIEVCGDGIVDANEDCDDNNENNNDTCTNLCADASCGDGFVQDGVEECEVSIDGPNVCDVDCTLFCGNGVIEAVLGEECDDNNVIGGDGCNVDCTNTQVSSISTGSVHTCAVLNDGNLRCWGSGIAGRLGYGNTGNIGDSETPASAGNINVGGVVVQVSAGGSHTCALIDNGRVRCWGLGSSGQLGYGNTNNIGDDETPASAGDINVGGLVAQVSAGVNHTCVVLLDGNIRCWGSNSDGNLGYQTSNIGDDETPAGVGNVIIGGTASQVAAGGLHTCAVMDTGGIRCWGAGLRGQHGYGFTTSAGDNESIADLGDVNIGETSLSVDAGELHNCALLLGGALRCWGFAIPGQLGYGNTNNVGDDELPVVAGDVGVGGVVVQIAASGFHTCALLNTGAVRCWGNNFEGQLGYGFAGNTSLPGADLGLGRSALQVELGGSHSCALLDNRSVLCWGRANEGQLGRANTTIIGDNEIPASVGPISIF